MAGDAPQAIVLALGAGVLGGPDALRLLLEFAGRGPVVDLSICIIVISILTAHVLGTMLLARFIGKASAGSGAPGAQATDLFARMTVTLSVGVAFLVTTCLLVVPGGLRSARLLVDFAVKSPIVAVLVIGATLPCIMPLLRYVRGAGNAGGAAPAAARAAERFSNTTQTVYFVGLPLLVTGCVFLVNPFVGHGGLDALRLFPGFTNMPVAVGAAVATVVGTTFLVRLSGRARNATGAGGATAPTPATDTGRLAMLTPLAVTSTLACLLVITCVVLPGREPDGAKHPCSV